MGLLFRAFDWLAGHVWIAWHPAVTMFEFDQTQKSYPSSHYFRAQEQWKLRFIAFEMHELKCWHDLKEHYLDTKVTKFTDLIKISKRLCYLLKD